MNKKLISLLAIICIILPNFKGKNEEITIKNDITISRKMKTYSSNELKIFKVCDYDDEKIRNYILKEYKNETINIDGESFLNKEYKDGYKDFINEEAILNSKITKTTRVYSSFNGDINVIFTIDDFFIENKELNTTIKSRRTHLSDINNNLESITTSYEVIENGISSRYMNFPKDEYGEYIINVDSLVLEEIDLKHGEYNESELLIMQNTLNSDRPLTLT